jgi:hypothetical protein
VAAGLAALSSMLGAVETVRAVAEWIRTPEAAPARRAIDRADVPAFARDALSQNLSAASRSSPFS